MTLAREFSFVLLAQKRVRRLAGSGTRPPLVASPVSICAGIVPRARQAGAGGPAEGITQPRWVTQPRAPWGGELR